MIWVRISCRMTLSVRFGTTRISLPLSKRKFRRFWKKSHLIWNWISKPKLPEFTYCAVLHKIYRSSNSLGYCSTLDIRMESKCDRMSIGKWRTLADMYVYLCCQIDLLEFRTRSTWRLLARRLMRFGIRMKRRVNWLLFMLRRSIRKSSRSF